MFNKRVISSLATVLLAASLSLSDCSIKREEVTPSPTPTFMFSEKFLLDSFRDFLSTRYCDPAAFDMRDKVVSLELAEGTWTAKVDLGPDDVDKFYHYRLFYLILEFANLGLGEYPKKLHVLDENGQEYLSWPNTEV